MIVEIPDNDSNIKDLISREDLKEKISNTFIDGAIKSIIIDFIDNAPTVEVPENAVNCVLTMFGKCSYNETGCSDCEIKDKIRKALSERQQGEWVENLDSRNDEMQASCYCSECGASCYCATDKFCHECGADMRGDDHD